MPPKKPTLRTATGGAPAARHQIKFANKAPLSRPVVPPTLASAAAADATAGNNIGLMGVGLSGQAVQPGVRTGTNRRRSSAAAVVPLSPSKRQSQQQPPRGTKKKQPHAEGTATNPDFAAGAPTRVSSGGATRVGRLLRDARAAVEAPYRPETPLEFLTTSGSVSSPSKRRGPPLRGVRLTALPASPTGDASLLVSSSSQLEPTEFMVSLARAEGNAAVQVALLRELMRWLANPAHRLWPQVVTYMAQYLQQVNHADSPTRAAPPMGSKPATSSETYDAAVAVVMTSVLLHNMAVADCPCLADVLLFLRSLAEAGLGAWLERELLFEPLLNLTQDTTLLQRQPALVQGALAILQRCTQANYLHPSQTPESTDAVVMQLVTQGIVVTLNGLTRKVLDMDQRAEGPPQQLGPVLMPTICLLYRNLAAGVAAHHLHKLGSLELLLHVLNLYKEQRPIVEAAARALAKAVFDGECLAYYASQELFIRTTMGALGCQLTQPDVAREPQRAQLLTARLAAAMAHVAEVSSAQCDLLATGGTALLLRLVELYVAVPQGGASHSRNKDGSSAGAVDAAEASGAEEDEQVTLQQAVVWLVGITAMSVHCPLDFVAAVAPRLTDSLKELDLQSGSRLTAVYTLMCLSNLSYFFAAIERADAGGKEGATSARLEKLYATLGIIIAGVLFEGDVEATVEATRLLGNVSFTNTGRDWMETNRCDEVILVFLGHEDLRVVYNCFGILLNLTAASSCRVVQEADLLQLLLKHTGRYTRDEDIAAAARDEKRLLLQSARAEGGGSASILPTEREMAERAATEAAKGFAEQTADLVEKLLANVFDLVHGDKAAEGAMAK